MHARAVWVSIIIYQYLILQSWIEEGNAEGRLIGTHLMPKIKDFLHMNHVVRLQMLVPTPFWCLYQLKRELRNKSEIQASSDTGIPISMLDFSLDLGLVGVALWSIWQRLMLLLKMRRLNTIYFVIGNLISSCSSSHCQSLHAVKFINYLDLTLGRNKYFTRFAAS